MLTEFFIKNILAEELFGSRICESLEDKEFVDYLYKEFLLERLLYGEPVTISELRALLRQKILNFEFIKLDGEIRPAKGTTMTKYIPQSQHPKGIRPSSPKVATFYDLEKRDWRSVSQRSKEIVLKQVEDTGKPIIMVKDKPVGGDVGVSDISKEPETTEQPILTIDDKPVDIETKEPKVQVKNVKPIKSTDETNTFYFINPETGASQVIDMTPKDAVAQIRKMGTDWKLVDKDEYDENEDIIRASIEDEPDHLEIGDKRNYLNRKGENIEIEITREDPYGGFYAKTPTGAIFKIPASKMQNIGRRIEKNDNVNQSSAPEDIIDKSEDLENIDAADI